MSPSYLFSIIILVLVLAAKIWSTPEDIPYKGQKLNSSTIKMEIDSIGLKMVLEKYVRNGGLWKEILEKIESGNSNWLEIAQKLMPEADAGVSEELEVSVGEAIKQNPDAVLRRFGFSICSSASPDVDGDKFNTYKKAYTDIQEKISKIKSVHDPALEDDRKKCLDSLNQNVESIKSFFSEK